MDWNQTCIGAIFESAFERKTGYNFVEKLVRKPVWGI